VIFFLQKNKSETYLMYFGKFILKIHPKKHIPKDIIIYILKSLFQKICSKIYFINFKKYIFHKFRKNIFWKEKIPKQVILQLL